MPETCTCGAQLPPDALFCHKCGKPQREIIQPELPVAAISSSVTVIPPPAFTPPPRFAMAMGFRNPVALRIALFVGAAAIVFMSLLPLVNWLAAGFFAVFFYRRKTHNSLNVGAGMHLGWITGVVSSVLWGVFFMAWGLSGKLSAMVQEQIKSVPSSDPYLQQMEQFMASGPGLLIVLAVGVVFITCLSMAGGALGAKIVGRE
jgi:hypothetical protein